MDAQTLRLKLAAVPYKIREWFSSETVLAQIKEVNKHFNIAGENRRVIPRLLLRLEIHDLEPEYFAGELAKELNLDRDKALAISAEIKRTILGSIKKELATEEVDVSLLDQFNIPIVKKVEVVPEARGGRLPTPSTIIGPPQKITDTISASATPLQPKLEGPKPFVVQPGSPQEIKTAEPSSVFKPIGEIKPFVPSPSTPVSPTSPVPPGKPTAPIPNIPPPMILHEEPTSAPLKKEFRLEMPQPKLSEVKLKSEIMKPAVLEFGPSSADTVGGKQMTNEKEKVRVVHYAETSVPSGKIPTSTGKVVPPPGREIKEITAPSFSGSDILKQLAASEVKMPIPPPPPVPKPPTPQIIPKPPMVPIPRILDEMKKPVPPTMSEIKPSISPLPRPRVEPPPIERKPEMPKPPEAPKPTGL